MTTTANHQPEQVVDRFPVFKVTRRGGPENTHWGISCLTCAKAGQLWFRCCESAEEVFGLMVNHQWPCPSEPVDPYLVEPDTATAALDAGLVIQPG